MSPLRGHITAGQGGPLKSVSKPARFRFASMLAVAPLALAAALLPGHQSPARRMTPPPPARHTAVLRMAALSSSGLARQATPIRHVVVIYLENQSFDSVLGFWCDEHRGRCPDGRMPGSVTLSNGVVVSPRDNPDRIPNVQHETIDQELAINGGAMNGWEKIPTCSAAYHYQCVSGYDPAKGQIPNITRLAGKFSISDMTFSMQDSPSWFGHLYAVAASTDGFTGNNPQPPDPSTAGIGWGCDSNSLAEHVNKQGVSSMVPSCIPDYALKLPNGGAYAKTRIPAIPTIMDRLNAAHLSWRIYAGVCTKVAVAANGLRTCKAATAGYLWSICPSFAQMLYSGGQCTGKPNAAGNGLVARGLFLKAATAGNLPAFSVVTPAGVDSCHNGFSMTKCDNWVGSLVKTVMHGPEWRSTALFITWDDCGGFYDQVPPGTNPDGTPQGPRVPVIIVSPYAKRDYTDTTPTTFAGILAYTEHTFGLQPLGVNDAGAYDFSNAFNYSQQPLKPVRMIRQPLPPSAKRIKLTPALLNAPS